MRLPGEFVEPLCAKWWNREDKDVLQQGFPMREFPNSTNLPGNHSQEHHIPRTSTYKFLELEKREWIIQKISSFDAKGTRKMFLFVIDS